MDEMTEMGIPRARWKKSLDKVKSEHKLLFFITITFLIYIAYSNQLVPNTQYVNISSRELVPLSMEKILDIYGEVPLDYSRPNSQVMLYGAGDYVPKSRTSPFYLIMFFIIIVSIILFNANRSDEAEFISDSVARRIIEQKWRYLKKTEKVKGELDLYKPFPAHHLRTIEIDGKRKPFEWVIRGVIIEEDEDEHFIFFSVHPYNQQMYMMIESKKDFERKDICPDCGKHSDIKLITTEEYQRLMELTRKTTK